MSTSSIDQLLSNLPASIWEKIAKIDELKGQWVGGAKLSPQILGRLKQSVLITSTGASTRIEGARLSDEDIEKMMRGISIQHFSDRDKQEVQGYFELLTNVFDSWQELHFSENLVKHFHQELLKYVEKDKLHRGEYKTFELIEQTKAAIQNHSYHPLLIIAHFIVQFLQIHPFEDGNGRLSRILTNFLMLQAGYVYMPYVSHEKLVEDNKPDYYMALRKSQKTLKTAEATIVPWLDFFLEAIYQQSKVAIELLSTENLEKLFSPTQMKVWQYIVQNHEARPLELSTQLSIPRPTINQVVTKLMVLKKVERLGQGRSTYYRLI